jgi:hypothetical protein
MSRAQQGAIESTEAANTAASTTAATTSQQAEQQDINTGQSQLAKFAANNPYVQGGQMQTATNQQLSNTADATAQAAAAKNQQQAQRTGQNAAAGVAAGEAEQQAAQRQLGGEEAKATESRLAAGTQYGGDVLKAQQGLTSEQAALSNNLTGEAQGQASTEEQAAQTPSFMDELGQGLITGAGQAGSAAITAFCPARGTLYLLPSGTSIPVEELEVGHTLEGIDGDPQIIEEIQTAVQPVLRIVTEDGDTLRCSRVHAFALPIGGFTVAAKCLGKAILTERGVSRVVIVEPDGIAQVFNVITDGSHTYRAGGLWSLGVGEAERAVSMDKWEEIGERMMQSVGA